MRVLRVIVNSVAFVLLLLVAFYSWYISPLYFVLFVLAALDQAEDVYYYVYNKRLVPLWMMPFDLMFEIMLTGVGIAMFVFSVIYYAYFQTWFFRVIMPLSIAIVYSAIEDVVIWMRDMKQARQRALTPKLVTHHVCEEKVVRSEKGKFVRRKK